MFSLPQAHRGFGPDGRIADSAVQQRFDSNILNFLNQVEATKHYPCIKQAWVEYLGEKPDPAIDRVEVAAVGR